MYTRPFLLSCLIVASVSIASGPFASADEPTLNSKSIQFNRQIRPIFNKHCTACHGGVKQAADISFVYRESVLPPNGWIVEPENPEDSILIERVTSDDPESVMPPPEHGSKLSEEDVKLLAEWIRQGAHWQEHWAYEKPVAPPSPNVVLKDWSNQPIDDFVLATLEQKGLRPSAKEKPARWLRRVSLDLTGLPPNQADFDQFINDLHSQPAVAHPNEAWSNEAWSNEAYSNAVDRLLESPSFGERWASVWLDQVRYADSKGLGVDGRRNAWKYRDWVIDALNRDLPFDQFTIKQIAGDLLSEPKMEDLIATAAHRLSQSNEEGGTDDEEFRVAAVLDRVSTTWQTWQGVTFGCVQCHSHPYGPFEHDEFYKFAAFFNNTADCDINEEWPTINVPLDTNDYKKAKRLDDDISDLNQKIWEPENTLLADASLWQPLHGTSVSSNNATKLEIEKNNDREEFYTTGTISQDTAITIESKLPKSLEQLTAIRLDALPLDPAKAVIDSEWGFCVSHFEASLTVPGDKEPQKIELARVMVDELEPFFDPNESLNPESNRGFAAYSRIHYPRSAAFVLKEPLAVPEHAKLRVTLKHQIHLLSAFSLVTRRGSISVSDDLKIISLGRSSAVTDLRNKRATLSEKRMEIKSTPLPILQERPEKFRRPSHVFARGNFLTKDKLVEPDTPASFPPLLVGKEPNRLDLALWLVSSENPLTARVAVNRFWARLFGAGIVRTEEDFGSSGEAPTHPELLDFLAVRFQTELNWSVKSLLREMVLSSTYRQSSKSTPELLERDPANRLLARGPRGRLSAEMVRDQALAISGLLSKKQFGPPVRPTIPEGVWKPFAAKDKWEVAQVGEEDRYRRSIYTYTKRSIPYPMFAAFDAPSREFCTPRRLQSNTPLQSLMMLNDQCLSECAAALAQRMMDSSEEPVEQIKSGFVMATYRTPDQEEVDQLVKLFERHGSENVELGMKQVATVLLNLDEVLTK